MTKNYTIDFQGLSVGEHHFSFDVSNDLFRLWSESPIENGSGKIEIDLLRHANFMELNVSIVGQVELECDRCADRYSQPIDFQGDVVVKISEKVDSEELDDDIIWLSPSDQHLDLSQWLYESVLLSLPLQRVHARREDCNKEVLKYINQ